MLQLLLATGTMALMISLVLYQIYKLRWLRSHGKQIIAMVTSIRHETGKTASGISRDNYYVTARWTNPRTGQTYTFWTWIMNSRPAFAKGSLVPVLIDPNNPERYALLPLPAPHSSHREIKEAREHQANAWKPEREHKREKA